MSGTLSVRWRGGIFSSATLVILVVLTLVAASLAAGAHSINLEAARSLGITVPDDLRLSAERVVD